MVIGGNTGNKMLDTVYRFEPDDEKWTLVEGSKLSSARCDIAAFPVKRDVMSKLCDRNFD